MTWVEWVEPFNADSDPVYLRVEKSVAIKTQKTLHAYDSDQNALDDFVTVHWAKLFE